MGNIIALALMVSICAKLITVSYNQEDYKTAIFCGFGLGFTAMALLIFITKL